jgi:uncharacterized protein YceH (UPF0502 family)
MARGMRDNVLDIGEGRPALKPELSADEARVIGALIEKEVTTPDQYPLSLNALTNACNQKSNRDPVVAWDERHVQQLLDGLSRRALAVDRSGFGSRVPKYRHLFCNTEFGRLKFSPQELAVICELLLRGPQTPGELRGRAQRMAPFADVGQVEEILSQLASRDDGPFVARLPREPGRREARYAQLFTGAPAAEAAPAAAGPAEDAADDRVERLEQRVARLEMDLAELRGRLGDAG